jgi:hypothetical protein
MQCSELSPDDVKGQSGISGLKFTVLVLLLSLLNHDANELL